MSDIYTVLSMRRSGCHAIAQWVGSLYDETCQYCNMGDKVTEVIKDGKMQKMEKREQFPAGSPVI